MEYRHPGKSSQTAGGVDFSIAVADRGYAWWYIDAWSDCGQHGLTIIAMLGCEFQTHPETHEFQVNIAQKDHYITTRVPDASRNTAGRSRVAPNSPRKASIAEFASPAAGAGVALEGRAGGMGGRSSGRWPEARRPPPRYG